MQPAAGPINIDDIHGLSYNDVEPLDDVQIPAILTGQNPILLEFIYQEFVQWLQGLPNIQTHLANTLEHMEERLYLPQLYALRLSIMSQFYMRHPSAELYNRR
jgi:hypothetical protein